MEQIDVAVENWVTNLASRLQLDSPVPSRPPLVSSGASSSSADAALGQALSQAPIQSAASLELLQELQRGLQQAALPQGNEHAAPQQTAASLDVLLPELQQRGLQQAGLPRAGSLSALRLPGGMPPPQQQELASPGRSDTASLPSDIEGLARAEVKEGNDIDLGKLEADLDEFESEGRNEPIVKRSWTAAEDATRPARLPLPLPYPEAYP